MRIQLEQCVVRSWEAGDAPGLAEAAAVRAVVAHGFASFSLERIFASVYANNPASTRVLEKAGFQYAGRMRRNVIKDGEILDSLLYARVRDDAAPL